MNRILGRKLNLFNNNFNFWGNCELFNLFFTLCFFKNKISARFFAGCYLNICWLKKNKFYVCLDSAYNFL